MWNLHLEENWFGLSVLFIPKNLEALEGKPLSELSCSRQFEELDDGASNLEISLIFTKIDIIKFLIKLRSNVISTNQY